MNAALAVGANGWWRRQELDELDVLRQLDAHLARDVAREACPRLDALQAEHRRMLGEMAAAEANRKRDHVWLAWDERAAAVAKLPAAPASAAAKPRRQGSSLRAWRRILVNLERWKGERFDGALACR